MRAKRIIKQWVVPGIFFFWGIIFGSTVINYVIGGYEIEYQWALIGSGLPFVMISSLFHKPTRKPVIGYLLIYGFGIASYCFSKFPGEIVVATVGLLIVSVVVFDYFRKET
jgi:hypothetical protein